MIDLAAVEALIAVDRVGSVHGAATDLGFTASAVSQQVKRLERELGVALLDRAGRGVVLTAAGRRVVEEGALLRDRVESLRSRLHDAGTRPSGTIRLGAFATAVRGIVPQLLVASADRDPDLRVTVTELDPWEAVAAVSAGSLDLALVHHWEGLGLRLPPGLSTVEVARDVADVLLPASDPLADRRTVTPAEIRDRIWTCTPDGTVCHEWFCHLFRGDQPVPRIDYRCLEFASQVALVAAGLAVALVPRLGRGHLPVGIRAVPVTDPVPTRPITLVWRTTMTDAPAVRSLRELLPAVA